MALVRIPVQPGFFRPSTRSQAEGRYYTGTLVRWVEGILQAIGGWTALLKSDSTAVVLDGPGRGVHTWRSNAGNPQLAVGTTDKLWHYAGGVLTDITPTGFRGGNDTGGAGSNLYGAGPYGAGPYGSGGAGGAERIIEAQSWQLDNFGEDLVAVAYSDPRLFYWDRSTGGAAAPVDNAPATRAAVVTEEGYIMALGCSDLDNSTIDGRQIRWTDGTNITIWEPDPDLNNAGQHKVRGKGQILGGARGGSQQVYVWTDYEFFVGSFVGGTFVYRFDRRGEGCGAVSRRAWAVVDGTAFWMGDGSFFRFDGYTQPLPCEVSEYVFQDFNTEQKAKVATGVNSNVGEVTWYYCSALSTEVDRYVTYNYRQGIWYFGNLERTCYVDGGVFTLPIAVDATGNVYEHETGTSYLDTDGLTALYPKVETGPLTIKSGQKMRLRELIPDEVTLGKVSLSLYLSDSPTASETLVGPLTAAQPTWVRNEARYVRFVLTQVTAGWRFGTLQVDAVLAGSRR